MRPSSFILHPFRFILQFVAVALLVMASGCRQSASNSPAVSATQQTGRSVTVVTPVRATIRRQVGQPGLIQAFERTPIVARIPGYVLKWNVDIGDSIHKNDILAELWGPEMVSELELKEEQVQQAHKTLALAKAQVLTATANVQEAVAAVARAQSTRDYWEGQNKRFTRLVTENVLDKQTKEDAQNQFRAAAAALSEAQAKVQSARAVQQEKEIARDKAEVDIRAADADRRRQADLVGYATLTAPYDGVVTQRNINTKQFVQPATGVQGDVLYVVERTDIVRVFVSVPETDAYWVREGAPATVRVQAAPGARVQGPGDSHCLVPEPDDPHPPHGSRFAEPGFAQVLPCCTIGSVHWSSASQALVVCGLFLGKAAEPRIAGLGPPLAARHVCLRHDRSRMARRIDRPCICCRDRR